MDSILPLLRYLVLAVLLAPLGAAALVALLGYYGKGGVRRMAFGFSLLHLGLSVSLAVMAGIELKERGDLGQLYKVSAPGAFQPIAVPGDIGYDGDVDSQRYETTWTILSLGQVHPNLPPTAIQFYVGVDGLNVGLVVLTSLMTLLAVFLSWKSVTERTGGYFAWLFVLEASVIGAFLAFDLILFYVFFELTLIPAFFLIGSWGQGSARRDAARKFFLYTLFGSLFTLVGLIGVVITNPTPLHPRTTNSQPMYVVPVNNTFEMPKEGPFTFSIPRLMRNVSVWSNFKAYQAHNAEHRAAEAAALAARSPTDGSAKRAAEYAEQERASTVASYEAYRRAQVWIFVALMAGFAVKLPLVPFHTWLPAAYGEAPIAITMILSAVLSKLGAFGILRIVLPLTPDPSFAYGLTVFGLLGAIGIVYAAFCAYAQRDMKMLTAYSSISHLGFLAIGLFAFNTEGIAGAALHMVNHGLSTGAMFGLLAFLVVRYRTLDMNLYGGLIYRYPIYAFFVFVICLAGIGLPGLNNFVSEMMMLAGVFAPANAKAGGVGLAVAAVIGILLSAWYVLTMIRRVLFGPVVEPPLAPGEPAPHDVDGREMLAFALPAILCLVLGLFPQPVIDVMKADVAILARSGDEARLRTQQFTNISNDAR